MADVLNAQDATLSARAGALSGTSMRYHELALQHWLNRLFVVREGYAVPVVFTNPMDAFSHFSTLWADENNPFRYLLDAKDEKGTPLYEPYPSPVRYPIISVHRKGWKYRSYQNFSQHRFRKINWPTVSDAGSNIPGKPNVGSGLGKCQLGNVTTSRMPTAWDYRFQVDHFCLRPDTQALYIEQLMGEFWRQGGNPQTWILVPYPGWGEKLVRLYIEGDIESLSPEEPEEGKNVEYRTSYTVVVEGFDVDLRYKIFPAFWTLIFQSGAVAVPPAIVDEAFSIITTEDVRIRDANPTLNTRPNVPSPCPDLIPDWKASRETLVLSLGGNITNVSDPDTFGQFSVYQSPP